MAVDTARLRELLAKATPGPWFKCGAVREDGPCKCSLVHSKDFAIADFNDRGDDAPYPKANERYANAVLTSEAITALPELLDRLDAAEKVLLMIETELEEEVKDGCQDALMFDEKAIQAYHAWRKARGE